MKTKINTRYKRLVKQEELISNKIIALQEECSHASATQKYGASTGNYDPSCDWYWIDWHCPDCGKHWTTDQ